MRRYLPTLPVATACPSAGWRIWPRQFSEPLREPGITSCMSGPQGARHQPRSVEPLDRPSYHPGHATSQSAASTLVSVQRIRSRLGNRALGRRSCRKDRQIARSVDRPGWRGPDNPRRRNAGSGSVKDAHARRWYRSIGTTSSHPDHIGHGYRLWSEAPAQDGILSARGSARGVHIGYP